MTSLTFGIALAIGGTVALIVGNSLYAAIERYFAKLRQARAASEAARRIAARVAAGDPDP